MTSTEKVRAMIAELRAIESDEANAALQAALLIAEMMGGQIEALIPEDPAELDELLLTGAAWALGLRGDDAETFVLTLAHEPQPLLGGDEDRAGNPLPDLSQADA